MLLRGIAIDYKSKTKEFKNCQTIQNAITLSKEILAKDGVAYNGI